MPRPLRIAYSGARYHVMGRGNRGAIVFKTDADCGLFLSRHKEWGHLFQGRYKAKRVDMVLACHGINRDSSKGRSAYAGLLRQKVQESCWGAKKVELEEIVRLFG